MKRPSCVSRRLVCGVAAALISAQAFAQQADPERLIEAGHWKRARALVETRLRQSPGDALSTYLLSQIHHAFGDDSTPRQLAETAVALDRSVAKYHRQLAETMGIQAQHAGPIQLIVLARQFRRELDTAIALDPHDVLAQRDLLEYFLVAPGIAGGDVQKAAGVAEHMAELDVAEGLLARARVAQYRGQTSQAEGFLRRAASSQPTSVRAQLELARFHAAKEHFNREAAETEAKEVLKIDRSRAEAWAILAEIYAGIGQWTDLDDTLSEATREIPDDLAPYYRAAETLLGNARDPVRAERYLRTYLTQETEGNEPTSADAWRKLDLAIKAQGGQVHTSHSGTK